MAIITYIACIGWITSELKTKEGKEVTENYVLPLMLQNIFQLILLAIDFFGVQKYFYSKP